MRQVLFTKRRSLLMPAYDEFMAKQPVPLSHKFKTKRSKLEAVNKYKENKLKVQNVPCPSSEHNLLINITFFITYLFLVRTNLYKHKAEICTKYLCSPEFTTKSTKSIQTLCVLVLNTLCCGF